jgi:hypothetical protein
MIRPRVLLADDHQDVSGGAEEHNRASLRGCGTLSDGRMLLEAAARLQPDIGCAGYWNAPAERARRRPPTQAQLAQNKAYLHDNA